MQTPLEQKLATMRVSMTPTVYDQVFRFFDFLKHNTTEKNHSRVYLTEQSIKTNLKKYFGHKTLFLDAQLYNLLSGWTKGKRIYFDHFVE